MDNKALLFDLQKEYLEKRKEMERARAELFQEIGKLTSLVQNEILRKQRLYYSTDRKDDNVQAIMLYFVERYKNGFFAVETSFHSVIWYELTKIMFGRKAKKNDYVDFIQHHDLIEIASNQEYQEPSIAIMSLIERELEEYPEIRSIIEDIFNSGKPWEKYLCKIKSEVKREQVEQFMISLKEKIYEEGEIDAEKYLQLSGL